ncbi:MAG TPA: signal recognition particle-docking protein FtsY [Actinomycetota bacterium]|nr:signal recognition particle-docking protein FtsY [Actinomycetota bacterium]
MEGLQIVLVVAAVLVLAGLLAAVPLVTGRRRRQDAGEVRQADLGREPGAGGGPGQPPRSGRGADVDLPDDRGVATAAPPAPDEVIAPRRRFRERLGRSRAALSRGMAGLLTRGADDDEAWDELEEALLSADVGVATATELVERLRTRARAEHASGPALRELLRDELRQAVGTGDRSLALDLLEEHQRPGIVLVVGVNGTGKTTTVGKLALALSEEGKQPVLAAADTFRAAATEQLSIWAERVGAPVVRHQQGADPAAVAFDGLASARARGADVLLVDTAGRLHTKTNLMEELRKLRRVLEREGGQVREVLLVLDATTGQNGLAQARQFTDAVGVTGVVLTKLDGTAKGGIVIAVQRDLGIPVKLVGLGEGPHDLAPFDPDAFVDALLSEDGA